MSLTKLLKSPIKLFKKDVITFLIIHRHDLDTIEDRLRYIAVKPDASLSLLRRKVWHLLDLPDYCDEIIILKSENAEELPLTSLRQGNDPQHPYILEVWWPETKIHHSQINMLTFGSLTNDALSCIDSETKSLPVGNPSTVLKSTSSKQLNKKPNLNLKSSTTSLFKLNGNRNKDNFTNILMKIQSDLCTLSDKLSNLENRIAS